MNMENKFEVEVLTRLAVIESKLDDFYGTKKKADEAHTKSNQNEKDIKEMKDKNQWAFRTAIGAIITSIVGIVFAIIQNSIK